MRLFLTAVGAQDVVDAAVDCEDDAVVADLARELTRHPALAVASVVQPVIGNPLGLVREATPQDAAPELWWRGHRLDPAEPLSTSPLRHGSVVGVGRAVPDAMAEPAGFFEVRIAGGNGAGRVRRLVPGSYTIGTAQSCDLVLVDPELPDVACYLEITAAGGVTITPDVAVAGQTRPAPTRGRPLPGPIVLPRNSAAAHISRWRRRKQRRAEELRALAGSYEDIDPQADVPLIHLDRRAVAEPTEWIPGTALVLGGEMLELAVVTRPDASLSPTLGGVTLDYNRPPRLLPPELPTEFSLPTIPKKPDKQGFPIAMMLIPAVMGFGMYFFFHSLYFLLFIAMTPLMALSTFSTSRRTAKRQYRQQTQDYAKRMRKVSEDAYAALVSERTLRRRDMADPAAMLVTATGPRARLWERRQTDPDWLMARVGTADAPSAITVRDPERESHEGALTWSAPDVPVSVSLAEAGITGIAGPDEVRHSIGRWVLAQAAVLHSPADLEIVLFADRDGSAEWSWLRWLPHARPGYDGGPVAQVATDNDSASALLHSLIQRLQARAAQPRGGFGGSGSAPLEPMLVVLDGARRLRLMPGMVSLLQDGPKVGMYFLCLDADVRQLPEECQAVVSVPDPRGNELRLSVTGKPDIDGIRPDLVDITWCEMVARALSPIRDVSSEDLSASLPTSSRLLSVLGMNPPDAAAIVAYWRGGGRTTRAVVGEGLDGPFALDIVRDGPHGLIAGTTGSGKSELLQTIIASLAVGNRPDEMTFVLIDYKGGAAFKDCDHLPHTVGMVTDLDGHLTTRALESLGAELRRREHQLAAVGAKDIEDYLAGRQTGQDPIPRLLIVIDEFAALAGELPDFVTGLVDIARRGRSLGVHLILATQRPAGVVSAEIKSNTNLRIALRVTDVTDSQDVLESGEAAAIAKSTPGRAYARLGHSSLIPFQSSRVGGRPRGATGRSAVQISEFAWSTLASPPPSLGGTVDDDDVSVPTDLATLVQSVTTASELVGAHAPPSPWLPPLPEQVTLEQAEELVDVKSLDDPAPLVFGMVDVPSQQSRTTAVYDLATAGNLCIAGAPRSGRSTALRAIAGAIARNTSAADVHLYGVDCGNNALLPLLSLPHTGAVVTRDQPDRLDRFTSRLIQTIGQRQQLLAEQGFADLREQRAAAAPADRMSYVVVLFDRWEGFVTAFDNYDQGRLIEEWLQILREGTGVGVKVVLAADRTAVIGRISTMIDDKLLLKMVDPSDYVAIGLPQKQVPDNMPPGRGFRSDGIRETQIGLLCEDPSGSAQVAALHELGRAAADRQTPRTGAQRPFRVDALPTRFTLAEAEALDTGTPLEPGVLPIAVSGDTLTLFGFDPVEHGPSLVIAGPRRSGRSTALRVLSDWAAARDWSIAVITPRQSPLREFPPDGATMFTLDSDRDEVTDTLSDLLDAEHSLLVLDDVELLGSDGWLADLVTEHVSQLRDTESLVIAGGALEEMAGVYRGPVIALKKSRSGLLLSPQQPGDGDLFGLRLPRSILGAPPLPGRGLLVRGGAYQGAQVVVPS